MTERERPEVSVVLPVRNGAGTLAESLDSVLGQTFGDFELVVVDDGSTDATPDVVAAYARRDRRVRPLRTGGLGLGGVCDHGWRAARGRYVARMDADDVMLPDRLGRQVAFLDAHPDVAAVGGAVDLVDAAGRGFGHEDYPLDDREIRDRLERGSPLVHPAVTLRRSALGAVGGYRPVFAIGEDYDLWLRLADRFRLANLPDTVLRYRILPTGSTGAHLVNHAAHLLAARGSAACRRAGRPDPVDAAERIDDAVLAALGVTDDQLALATVEHCSWWARTLTRAGYLDAAREPWRQAYLAAGRHPDRDALRERLARAEAASLRQRGDRLRAALVPVRRRARRSSRR